LALSGLLLLADPLGQFSFGDFYIHAYQAIPGFKKDGIGPCSRKGIQVFNLKSPGACFQDK
jgi:hypothetical protein